MRRALAVLILSAASPLAWCGDKPAGIYICRGFDLAKSEQVDFPFADGWLVRPLWSAVEPEAGRFDFGFIEKELATARRLNKKIALMVYGGPDTPSWVYAVGARKFSYARPGRYNRRRGEEAAIPYLWDEAYLRAWTDLVRHLGWHFAEEPRIALIHISGATENGMEMQLPHSLKDEKAWRRAGYTPEKTIAAWKRIIDAYAEAFPRTPMDIDVHPVLGSERVAREVSRYGRFRLGARFGLYGGWLSGKSAEDDAYHADMHALVREFGARGFLDFQMIGKQTGQLERFAPGGLKAAFEQGMGWGARYFEVWDGDVKNPALHPLLETFARRLREARP